MSRIHLKEHELRAVIRAALNEAAPSADKAAPSADKAAPSADVESSAVDMMGDLVKRTSGFSPATRLQLINKLTGVDKTGWWNDVLEKCSIDNVIKVKASGGRTWSGNDSTLYSRQPAQFLNGFLNFCISSIMSGKDIQLSSISTPKAGAIDQTLTLSANKFFDVIVSDDGTTAYVYPALPALVDQCRTYFSTENVKTFEDQDFALVLLNETFLQKVIKTELPARDPDASTGQNLCWTYVPERKQAEIRSGIEAANAQAVEGLQAVLDKTDDEVYEAYLYTPLLMPQVWKNPDLSPESPLYTPWRMTYAACNLMADIMINHGDLGKYAVLSHLFRLADRGTQLNIFDAPGMDYAVGKSESVNEAHLIVKGMFLTETDLRRVIRAALEYNILNEGDLIDAGRAAARGVSSLATGTAELGAELGAAAVKSAREAGEASLTASQKLNAFVDEVKLGSHIKGVITKLNLFSAIPAAIRDSLFSRIHRSILVDATPSVGLPGGATTPFDAISTKISREIAETLSLEDGGRIDDAEAQNVAEAFRILLFATMQRAANINADEADAKFKTIASRLSQNTVLAINAKAAALKVAVLDPEILTDVGDIFIPSTKIDQMRTAAAVALQRTLQLEYPTTSVKVEHIVDPARNINKITLLVPKPTAVAGTGAGRSMTLDTTNLIDIDTLPSVLTTLSGTGRNALSPNVATALYNDALTRVTGVANLDTYRQSAAALNNGNEYIKLRQQVTLDYLDAAADALPLTLANRELRGTLQMPPAPRTGMAKFFVDKIINPAVDTIPKLNPYDPSQGVMPFFGLPANVTDVHGRMIQSASLTSSAWKTFKSSASVAMGAPTSSGAAPTKAERAGEGAWAAVKFIGALAATAFDSAAIVGRGTTLLGMKGLQGLGGKLAKSPRAIPRGVGQGLKNLATSPISGRLAGGAAGHGVAAAVAYAVGWIGSDVLTTDKQQKSSTGVNVAKTLAIDLLKQPITLTNKGMTFLSGGPLRFVADIVLGVYEDNSTQVKDFNAMMEALSGPPGTPPTAKLDKANEVLSNLFSNLLKNAFTANDTANFIKYFPKLVTTDLVAAMIPKELRQESYAMMKSAQEGTKAAVTALLGGEYRSAEQRLEDATRAGEAAAAKIRARLDTFESQKKDLGVSFDESSEILSSLESSRTSVVAVTIRGIKDDSAQSGASSIAGSIAQFQSLLVEDTFGRGSDDSEEVLRGQYSEIAQFLFDSSDYFDVLTKYYETAAGDEATALASAVGPLGLEFSGDLDDAKTKEIMTGLAGVWATSGASVAEVLSAMADLEKTE